MTSPNVPVSIPVAIGSSAGWFHPGRSSHGVLLCGPIGFETLCARLSLHVLADLLAARGISVLRFDYPGEGDSLDFDPSQGFVAAAIESVSAADQWLRGREGIDTISLVALRIGVPLAITALEDRSDIASIAYLAPVTSGRHFVRETKMASQFIAELRPGQDAGPGELNLCGFRMSAPDVEAVSKLTVRKSLPCRRLMLAMESDRLPPPTLIGGVESGAVLTTLAFNGYARMNAPPTQSVVPFAELNEIADWLAMDTAKATEIALPAAANLATPIFRETQFRFGPGQRLAGVYCEPIGSKANGTIVHLLNAGANYHIGWARMSVDHARALAADGTASLRYDFSGIGDASWFDEGPRGFIYAPIHVEDALIAVEFMEQQGFQRQVLSGLCAGGYIAFQAAAADPRVAGSVVANAIRLVWHPHDNLDTLESEMIQSSAIYKQKALSAAEWKKLLSGNVSFERVARVGTRIVKKVANRLLQSVGVEPTPAEDTRVTRQKMQTIAGRGGIVTFIHAERDQSRDESERHFGANMTFVRKLPGVSILDIANADHELTSQAARDAFLEAIKNVVRTVNEKGPA